MELMYRNRNFRFAYLWMGKYGRRVNAGMLLLVVAVITMIIANSPLGPWYEKLWSTQITLGTDTFNFLGHGGHNMTLLDFVNDALMAIFFFSVGLEIKREMLVGELSSFRQVLLPFLGACGGMIIPVLIFYVTGRMQGFSPDEFKGMAIPMATDIAFSIGVLSLFSKRVPLCVKVFLLTLAIVDDIGGIIVIALFYSHLSPSAMMYGLFALAAFAVLLLGNRLRINNKLFYLIFGLAIWWLFLQIGIHPTIAGVLVAFTVPARPYINIRKYSDGIQNELDGIKATLLNTKNDDILLSNMQIRYLTRIEGASNRAISPLQDLENSLHGFVNFFVMPVFAFANAGVVFQFAGGIGAALSGITLSIMAGLVLGKSLGIFSFTWLAIKLKLCRMPFGMSWKNLFGVCMLGGIGFTVALFLASLSYPVGSDHLNEAKLGIVLGSFISGILGYIYLNIVLPKAEKNKKE